MKPALQTAKEVFSCAKSQIPSGCELEVYLSQGRGRGISWSEGKCEEIHQAEGGGAGIRVIDQSSGSGQQGYAFTTSFLKESIEKTAKNAYESAKNLPSDSFRKLPLPSKPQGNSLVNKDLLADVSIFSDDIPPLLKQLEEGEQKLLKKYPLLKSVLRASFSEGINETAIVNSNGIEESFPGTYIGLGVSCLAEKNDERQENGYGQTKRFRKDLDWQFIFEKSAERTIALLEGKTIPSGIVPVIFDPSVACGFISLISNAVCADSVQKGKSFLAGKLNETVASKEVTLIDDGTLEKGLATSPVDDEGIPAQKTAVISRGKLVHYLYDYYTALKDKTVSTGNASRSGFKSSPGSGTTNFYLQAGGYSREKLLKETCGLYLYEVMGLHMADPISGDFSVGVMGAWLENGEFKTGVRGVTLAGNLVDLLKNVDQVCGDLTFFGSLGSPTFRAQGLMVSGSSNG